MKAAPHLFIIEGIGPSIAHGRNGNVDKVYKSAVKKHPKNKGVKIPLTDPFYKVVYTDRPHGLANTTIEKRMTRLRECMKEVLQYLNSGYDVVWWEGPYTDITYGICYHKWPEADALTLVHKMEENLLRVPGLEPLIISLKEEETIQSRISEAFDELLLWSEFPVKQQKVKIT